MATFSATNRPKVKNPYETSVPAGSTIGPSQGVITPPPTTRSTPAKFAPVQPTRPIRPHTGYSLAPAVQNPYQAPVTPTPAVAPAPAPAVAPAPVVATPPAVPTQPSFTTVANPTGGLSGYGQGGVWAGGNTTATTGGLLPTGGTAPVTPHGSDYVPPSQHKSMRDQFAAGPIVRGGMTVQNPYLGEADPATQGVLKQLQAGGIDPANLPGAKIIYEMMNNSGLTPDQVLKHFQAIYNNPQYKNKNDAGYSAAMAGHGANFRNNYDVNQKIKGGQYGQTGWIAGDTGSVSDARKNAINQMRGRQNQGALGTNWGAGTDPKTWGSDPLVIGGTSTVGVTPNTDMGNIGAHGPNPATGGGAYGPLAGGGGGEGYGPLVGGRPTDPGRSGSSGYPGGDPFGGGAAPGGQRHELPGLGGEGGNRTPAPGGGTVPAPRPKPPKGGYIDPNMIGRIFNGLASLFQ